MILLYVCNYGFTMKTVIELRLLFKKYDNFWVFRTAQKANQFVV